MLTISYKPSYLQKIKTEWCPLFPVEYLGDERVALEEQGQWLADSTCERLDNKPTVVNQGEGVTGSTEYDSLWHIGGKRVRRSDNRR